MNAVEQRDLILGGFTPTVLAGWLGAAGVFRLVSEQLDPDALAWWDPRDRFHLATRHTREELARFFESEYRPSPIFTPWNSDSYLHAPEKLAEIDRDDSDRFGAWRNELNAWRGLMRELDIDKGALKDETTKRGFIEQARARLSDRTVEWLDAVCALSDKVSYAAVLGSGGNDGRLEFSNNFVDRIIELTLTPRRPSNRDGDSPGLAALLSEDAAPVAGARTRAAVGMLAPSSAGGVNMGAGFDGASSVNPWEYILALEGIVLLGGCVTRRLDRSRATRASFPFQVSATPTALSSASMDEGNRGELWVPCWTHPTPLAELKSFMGEGRIQLGRRTSRDGVDVVRSIASLGADRGVARFHRHCILLRNGSKMYFATHQGGHDAVHRPVVELLSELDPWLDRVGRIDKPSPILRARLSSLKNAMFDLARGAVGLAAVVAAVGLLQRALVTSPRGRKAAPWRGALSPAWLSLAADGSPEFEVARAVASWRDVRRHLEGLDERMKLVDGEVPLWTERRSVENIVAVARARIHEHLRDTSSARAHPLAGAAALSAESLDDLRSGLLDDQRLTGLVYGLALVRSAKPAPATQAPPPPRPSPDDAGFGLLRAVFSPRFLSVDGRAPSVSALPQLLTLVASGQAARAVELAKQRLRGSRCALRASSLGLVGEPADPAALAAALVVPLPRFVEEPWIHAFVTREELTQEISTP